MLEAQRGRADGGRSLDLILRVSDQGAQIREIQGHYALAPAVSRQEGHIVLPGLDFVVRSVMCVPFWEAVKR